MALTFPRRRPGRRSARGSQLVELALVLPLLLVLIAGVVDYALLFHDYLIVANAAREGARLGVQGASTPAAVQARVAAYVAGAGLTGTPSTVVSSLSISPGAGGAAFPARRVQVTYEHQFQLLGPMLTLIGGAPLANVTLTARSSMRSEVVVGS